MTGFIQALRDALRSLPHDVPFAVSTATTLGLGIGLVTGFFAIANAVLLRPLAPHGDIVIRIWKIDADRTIARFPISYPELPLWRDGSRSVQSLAAIRYAETSPAAVMVANEPVAVTMAPVSAHFFEVVHGGTPLLGRWFNASDEGNAVELAAVVSERLWRRLSGGEQSFVGRRLPTTGDASARVNDIRRALHASEPGIAVHAAATMERLVANEIARPRMAVTVAMIFAAMAIVVAAIGVYTVFAYDLLHRGRELAVRAALGASPRQIVSAALRTSLALGAIGAVAGLATASVLTRFLQTILFEVTALDATSFAAAGVGLLAVVVAASAGPALRAARANPVRLLRTE